MSFWARIEQNQVPERGYAVKIKDAVDDAAAERLQLRWFAAFKAASLARAECEALLDTMEQTELAWNAARQRLAWLEGMRDALGEKLSDMDEKLESHRGGESAAAFLSTG